jgi:anion-transporting  ArsA/GET3 family ATPase
MLMDELLRRRLVFLSGKGGVGKSTVGLALAVAARERGKRVLVVEIDAPLEAARVLGRGPAGPREAEVLPGIFTVNLEPRAVMDEYVKSVVPTAMLARRVIESPVYARFFAAAPGLPELMVLGKILTLEEAREPWSRKPRYDLVVVDAPATGHGLSLLRVPRAAAKAVPVGPVGANARRIQALLEDASRTTLALVAIPEEMAVVEAVELHESVGREVGIHQSGVVLNACHERRLDAGQEAEVLRLAASGADGPLGRGIRLRGALAAGRRHIRRCKLTRFYRGRLKKALSLPLVSLPYLFDEELREDALRTLAERLEAS